MERIRRSIFGVVQSILSVAALCAIAGIASADVPGRVGRIAFMQGDVQSYSDSDPTWKAAYVNQPITSRNSVFVGDGGRVEISVGSTTLALDAGAQVDIQQLDDNVFDANVVRGRVSMTVRRFDPDDQYQVAIPGADFALLKPGRYRLDALDDTSGVTVFSGQASLDGNDGPVLVNAGNALRSPRDPSNPNAEPAFQMTASAPTAIDDWVASREARFRESQTARYVSPDTTGYEDLEANGRWSNEADLGPVWYPTTVSAEWVPYRYGRWAYVAPWGYTWIDDASWGFAPFHYGRWIQVGPRWGWVPGTYVARPVYAPALVGFYGGAGVSVSFAVGAGPAVGWYPLAPWQRYSPHYTQNVTYVNRVNNITIVNPPARFARRDAGGDGRDWNRFHGGTVVPQNAFASQRSISRVAMAPPRDFASRAGPLNVAALPRPAEVPAAIRQGPRAGEGIRRPEFRSPRDFAQRPVDQRNDGNRAGPPRAGQGPAFEPQRQQAETARRGPDQVQQQQRDQQQREQQQQQAEQSRQQQRMEQARTAGPQGALPPNYRRLPEGQREARTNGPNAPNGPDVDRGEAGRPNSNPGAATVANDRFATRGRPNVPNNGEVRTQAPIQQNVPQASQDENARRFQQQQDMRNQQRSRPVAPNAERAPIERPQIERPRFERPAPIERHAPSERPAIQQPAAVAPPRPAPQAPPQRTEATRQKMEAAGIERRQDGGPNRDRGN